MHACMCRQVRVFSSRDHTRALGARDVWAVVGWSGDLIPLAERAGDLVLVAPASGTPLWADLWAVPAGACGGSGVSVYILGAPLFHAAACTHAWRLWGERVCLFCVQPCYMLPHAHMLGGSGVSLDVISVPPYGCAAACRFAWQREHVRQGVRDNPASHQAVENGFGCAED